jgi:hypothetical protein
MYVFQPKCAAVHILPRPNTRVVRHSQLVYHERRPNVMSSVKLPDVRVVKLYPRARLPQTSFFSFADRGFIRARPASVIRRKPLGYCPHDARDPDHPIVYLRYQVELARR